MKMYTFRFIGLYLLLSVEVCVSNDEVCDRRPLGIKTDPLPPDNQFLIDIDDIRDNKYIPKTEYKVRLHSRDDKSTFIAFTISLGEDSIYNKNNPRKPIRLNAGRLEILPNTTNSRYKTNCNDTIVESDITPKTTVEALWIAPDKDNKCVTIFAVVAVKPDVWYNFEGPLSKRVCEDTRKAEDMAPMENDNCQVCEDARYQVIFEGMWSYNTHPNIFPSTEESKELARFSDVVGASHNKDFTLYKYNSQASLGLQMLAEQGNTTQLELEIQAKLGTAVRTVIKATGPPKPNMTTIGNFRASREHHLVSLATAILPSPDWFLGVANLELCEVRFNRWADSVRLNLYPMDAGTDNGLTFESSNEPTLPHQLISLATIRKDTQLVKPFAKLHFNLIRTYGTPYCATEVSVTEDGGSQDSVEDGDGTSDGKGTDDGNGDDENGGGQEPSNPTVTTTREEPVSKDPDSTLECPMSPWEEWLPCEGECINSKLVGFQMRFRYHIVDNVAVDKNENDNDDKVPRNCFKTIPVTETRECEESCEEKATAERRIWKDSISPGNWWGK